jgi:hypothetical protein
MISLAISSIVAPRKASSETNRRGFGDLASFVAAAVVTSLDAAFNVPASYPWAASRGVSPST